MKYISLFAGIGGFDLALDSFGYECMYANDIDKYCKIIYDKNFASQIHRGTGEAQTGNGEADAPQSCMEPEGQGIRSIGDCPNYNEPGATGEVSHCSCIDRDKNGRGKENQEANDEAKGEGLESQTGKEISFEKGQSSQHCHCGADKGAICYDKNNLNQYQATRKCSCAGRDIPNTCLNYVEGTTKNHADRGLDNRSITEVTTDEIPDHELLVGGFPCQAFSIAGKRGGFNDTRGTLFFEIARILKAKQPRLCVLENVKGLLSHDNGRTFKTILATLTELGYDLQWQVLNSKNFGVPQNRERVFIVGHLRGTARPEIFPITGTNSSPNEGIVSTALDANYWKGIDNHGQRTAIVRLDQDAPHYQDRIYGTDGIAPTIPTAATGGNLVPKILQKSADWREDGSLREFTENAPTIRANMGDNHPMVNHNMKIRRLTPLECERLQGFPDNWTAGVSDTQRYKMLGNAVTVNVVKAIVQRLE